jgi:hypothetical protein
LVHSGRPPIRFFNSRNHGSKRWGQINFLGVYGLVLRGLGELDQAATVFAESAMLFRRVGDAPRLCAVHLEHAAVEARRGCTDAAERLISEADNIPTADTD